MGLRVARTVCALMLASFWACGLEKGGLLDDTVDGGDPDQLGGGRGLDATTDVQSSPGDDGAASEAGDGTLGEGSGDDAGAGAPDAERDGRGGGGQDARTDAPRDARALVDVGADADAGRAVDGSSEAALDAAGDDGPMPIVWDGSAITDPQFDDIAWISFCNQIVGCGLMSSVDACMAHLAQPLASDTLVPPPYTVQSVNNATSDCPVVRQAIGDGSSCPSTTPDSCSGNSLVTCRLGFKMTVDCTSLGMVCSNGSGNPGCGFGDCSASQEGQTFCVGTNYLTRCTSGRYVAETDCQTFGGSCVGPGGAAQCQGTGAACAGSSASCAGSKIVVCMAGMQGGIDCATAFDPTATGTYTFSCLVDDAGTPYCGAGTTCDPATTTDTCATSTITGFCNAGTVGTYNCSSFWNLCDGGHCAM